MADEEYNLAVSFWANSCIGALKSAKTWEQRKDILNTYGLKIYNQGKEDVREEFRQLLKARKDYE